MRNTLVVAWREFSQRVRSRGFILGSLAMPVIFMIIWGFTVLGDGFGEGDTTGGLEEANMPDQAIGYVDQSGLIRSLPDAIPAHLFRPYPDVQSADRALENGEIGAYYLVPEDYRESGDVRRISRELPTAPSDTQLFDRILISNLTAGLPPQVSVRLKAPIPGDSPLFVSLADEEQGSGGFNMAPFLVVIVVMIPLFTSGGYLLQSLTEEKSNRIMEILLVSLKPRQLLAGKLIGLGALTLVQYTAWITLAAVVVLVSGVDLNQGLAGINLSTAEIALMFPFAIGGFALYASISAGIGALATDIESSRTWVFVISLPMLLPMYFGAAIASAPDSILAVALSLIPFSAPITMLMRIVSAAVPAWQIALSLGLLFLTSGLVIWLMARLFRVQTLLSGESISLQRMWAAFTG